MSIHMGRCLAAVVGTLLTLAASRTVAMEFSFQPIMIRDSTTTILVASGEIRPGDANRLRQFLARNEVPSDLSPQTFMPNFWRFMDDAAHGGASGFIDLDSRGGDVEEAIKLAQLLREMLANVVIVPPAVCASACFFMYVGAAQHNGLLGRTLAIHRPFFSPDVARQMSAKEAEAAHKAAFVTARRWLQDQFVPQALIDKMFSLPSTQAYWLTDKDVVQLGMRAPWYEEWMLARCPDYLKVMERADVRQMLSSVNAATAIASSADYNKGIRLQDERMQAYLEQAYCEKRALYAEQKKLLLHITK